MYDLYERVSYLATRSPIVKMPRTKRNRAVSKLEERDAAVKTFERHVQLRIAKMERDALADLKGFEAYIEVIVSRLPEGIRRMTLGELLDCQNHDNQKENCNDEVSSSVKDLHMQPPAVPKSRKVKLSKTAKRATTTASDDGYATERTSVGSTSRTARIQARATSTMRTRSFTSKANLSEINQKMVSS